MNQYTDQTIINHYEPLYHQPWYNIYQSLSTILKHNTVSYYQRLWTTVSSTMILWYCMISGRLRWLIMENKHFTSTSLCQFTRGHQIPWSLQALDRLPSAQPLRCPHAPWPRHSAQLRRTPRVRRQALRLRLRPGPDVRSLEGWKILGFFLTKQPQKPEFKDPSGYNIYVYSNQIEFKSHDYIWLIVLIQS